MALSAPAGEGLGEAKDDAKSAMTNTARVEAMDNVVFIQVSKLRDSA